MHNERGSCEKNELRVKNEPAGKEIEAEWKEMSDRERGENGNNG